MPDNNQDPDLNNLVYIIYQPMDKQHKMDPDLSVGLITHKSNQRTLIVMLDRLERKYIKTEYAVLTSRFSEVTQDSYPDLGYVGMTLNSFISNNKPQYDSLKQMENLYGMIQKEGFKIRGRVFKDSGNVFSDCLPLIAEQEDIIYDIDRYFKPNYD